MHGADPQQELERFFGALSTVVEAERKRCRASAAVRRQEVEEFFTGLTSEIEEEEEDRRGQQTRLQEELGKFLCELNEVARTEEQRRGTAAANLTRDLTGMFGLLEPTIAVATIALKIIDEREGEERDRRTGRRFSTFDLVRTQELDLSRIFGELMDPTGTHSQGDLFLSLLLEELNVATRRTVEEMSALSRQALAEMHEDSEVSVASLTRVLQKARKKLDAASRAVDLLRNFRPPGGQSTVVHLEYPTDWVTTSKGREKRGSVDLVLQFDGNRWIGIENKPWAHDQDWQVDRYLLALLREVERRGGTEEQVLVLYWSGDGSDPELPSVESWPKDKKQRQERLRERCLTVPYRTSFGMPSVEGWLRRCCVECEAERVRLFLYELLDYIRKNFPTQSRWKLT